MMKWVSYAKDAKELEVLRDSGASEVLLSGKGLSRLGVLELAALHSLAHEARRLDLRPVLEWDILMTSEAFTEATALLGQVDLNLFSAIRVQDPGALEFVLRNCPAARVQLVLETGNHNFEAIQRWCEYGGDRIERLVLSIELTKNQIAQYIQKLSVPVEVLGLGPILLFYTPRHLLSNQRSDFSWKESAHPWVHALANSEETQHKGFRIIENRHGTFMFHSKDYCVLDKIEELCAMGLAYVRIDFRLENDGSEGFVSVFKEIGDLLRKPSNEKANEIITHVSTKVIRCFFQSNATDVLFKKLKNTLVQRQDSGYIGEVVEISKDHHTIISVLGKGQRLKLGQALTFINPAGRTVEHTIHQLQDLDQNSVTEISQGDFAVIPYLKFATPKSAVYDLGGRDV